MEAAIDFRRKFAGDRKLRIACKSIVVASTRKLADRIVNELRDHDIVIKAADAHRDIGVLFAPGKRNCSLIKSRFEKAKARNARVVRIAHISRAARKLYRSGTFPQGTWGHAIVGFAPSRLKVLRQLAAAATGINQAQRCLTSAVSFGFGKRSDPWPRLYERPFLCGSR